jgi:hypothetical protein
MSVQNDYAMVPLDSVVEEFNYAQAGKGLKNEAIARIFKEIFEFQCDLEEQINEKKSTLENRCFSTPHVKTSVKVAGVMSTLAILGGMVGLVVSAPASFKASTSFNPLAGVAISFVPLMYGIIYTGIYLCFHKRNYYFFKDLETKSEAAKSMLDLLLEFDKPKNPSSLSTLIREAWSKWSVLEAPVTSIFFETIFQALQPLLPIEDKINKYVELIKANLDNLTIYQKSWRKLDKEMKITMNYIHGEKNYLLHPKNQRHNCHFGFKPRSRVFTT